MEEKRRDAGTLGSSFTGGSGDSPSSEPASTRRRPGSLKRKANAALSASNSSSAPSKRMMTREKAMLISQPLFHNGPLTRARQAPTNLDTAMVAAAGVKQELENAAVDAKDSVGTKEEGESNKAIEEWEALEAKIDAEFEAIRSRESNVHVVPNHCGWFSWTKIHPVEERLLPSFFNGKCDGRTPDVYLELRNWIVKKFHANPKVQVELKDLSELDVGDLEAKQEVVEFLDYWGLINFHPFPAPDSAAAAANDGKDEEAKCSLIEKLYSFPETQSLPAVVPKPHVTAPAMSTGLFPESMVADDLLKQEGPSVEYHCNSCSADCSRKRYHCPKQADYDLCTECFNSGKFDSGMSSSDFILMEPAEAPGIGSGKWTDQETLLLLEGLELFKENWSEIAEHVATKTKAQCMLHFLQMPIEDAFLDYDDDKGSNSKETTELVANVDDKSTSKDAQESVESKNGVTDNQPPTEDKPKDASAGKVSQETLTTEDGKGKNENSEVKVDQETSQPASTNDGECENDTGENFALKALREAFEAVGYPLTHEKPLSFADVGNPVMALAAFLGKLAGSDITTASAHASLKSVESYSGLWLATMHCFVLEDPPENKKESVFSESPAAKVDHNNDQKDKKPEGCEADRKSSPASDNRESANANSKEECGDSDLKDKRLSPVASESAAKTDAPRELMTSKEGKTSSSKEVKAPKSPNELKQENSEKEAVKEKESAKRENTSQPMQESGNLEMTNSLPLENNDLHQTAVKKVHIEPDISDASASIHENRTESDEHQKEDDRKERHNENGTKDEQNIKNLKRAAVSALAGAAVKAKLLAEQEEDQIRQLSASLVEKQLQKLETKLMFFSEVESMTMRVREQLERSRQRLYHERAQIIAARLGVPPSSSSASPAKTVMPTNRIATNFANAVPRLPMGLAAYPRPPMPRPMAMMGTIPNASNPLLSTAMMSSTGQPSGSDKVSSA